MSNSFIAVPPDAAGKKVFTKEVSVVEFANETTTFSPGMIITGATSGATGTIQSIEREGWPSGEGELYLKNVSGTFVVGENLQVSAVTYAQVGNNNSVDLHIQKVILTDPIYPEHGQYVDGEGAAYIRFAEGAIQFDGFGRTQVSEGALLGEYIQEYDELPDLIDTTIVGGGSIAHSQTESSTTLSVGTSSGDKVTRTTNKYHKYRAGQSQLIQMTSVCGDSGKANVRRRWGYFDDNDGVFFELDGTTLYVVLRSSTTGSVVDTKIAQSNWSHDKLDGTGTSGVTLDITKANIFWIDLQWLGAGKIRFGVGAPSGVRIVSHVFENANANPRTYMRTGSLPLRWEIENYGVSASTSEFKQICASVETEGGGKIDENHKMNSYVLSAKKAITDAAETPLISFKATQLLNGITNRKYTIPELFENYIDSASTSPVIFRLRRKTSLTGATFNKATATSILEIDEAATALVTAGEVITSHIGEINSVKRIDVEKDFSYLNENIALNADGVSADIYTLTAQCIESGGTANILTTFCWHESG